MFEIPWQISPPNENWQRAFLRLGSQGVLKPVLLVRCWFKTRPEQIVKSFEVDFNAKLNDG